MKFQDVPHGAQLLRLPAVMQRTGLSRTSIYRLEAAKKFPSRIKLTERSTAWLASDIESWVGDRIASSRQQVAA